MCFYLKCLGLGCDCGSDCVLSHMSSHFRAWLDQSHHRCRPTFVESSRIIAVLQISEYRHDEHRGADQSLRSHLASNSPSEHLGSTISWSSWQVWRVIWHLANSFDRPWQVAQKFLVFLARWASVASYCQFWILFALFAISRLWVHELAPSA